MSAATKNEMERLKEGRDAAIEQVIYWRERAVGTEGERDALAAHIHQLDNVCRHLSRHCEDKHWRRMHELLEGGPTGSIALARLKAEWQAEAMEGWLEQMRYMEGLNTFDCMESAELYAEELRRQAE